MEPNKERPFYKGELVDLLVATEELALQSNWADWFNSQQTTANTHHGIFPNTRQNQVDFVNSAPGMGRLSLLIAKSGTSDLIGTVSLSGIEFRRGVAEVAIIMDTESEFNYHPLSGFEALSIMIVHAFDVMGLERIDSAQVFPQMAQWNQWMELLGFQSEGIKRNAFKKGNTFSDAVIMGCLRKDYEKFVSRRNGRLWGGKKLMMKEISELPVQGFATLLAQSIEKLYQEYFD